jgi:hypothetical protein
VHHKDNIERERESWREEKRRVLNDAHEEEHKEEDVTRIVLTTRVTPRKQKPRVFLARLGQIQNRNRFAQHTKLSNR